MIAACSLPDCKAIITEAKTENKEKEEIHAIFQAGAQGNLVLSETTRINIEKLSALNTPEELAEKCKNYPRFVPKRRIACGEVADHSFSLIHHLSSLRFLSGNRASCFSLVMTIDETRILL